MTAPETAHPPVGLSSSVALVAASMLLVELIVTRIFSVLYFYHYSFFAVSLVMSGLALGGLAASRWNVREMEEAAFRDRLAALAAAFSAGVAAALAILLSTAQAYVYGEPTIMEVAFGALAFLPGLAAAGAFLAAAFARREAWIGRLYAYDLAAAGLACLGAVGLLRVVQGPAGLLIPIAMSAVAAAALAPRSALLRIGAWSFAAIAAAGAVLGATGSAGYLRLRDRERNILLLERWNEHSRIVAYDADAKMSGGRRARMLVIDKSAATFMPAIPPRAPGAPPPIEPWWSTGITNLAYQMGRPLDRVAIIGMGGGRDALAAIAGGAREIDGYDINGILLDLLKKDFAGYNSVASWPEVNLIHSEARVGIGRSEGNYDVIHASLIDTWSATASGGLTLSENGLYTREGWETFIRALSERGILTMTRWHVRELPAEMHRLVALAAASLEDAGVLDVRSRLMLVAFDKPPPGFDPLTESIHRATILVSKAPFTPEEVARVQGICRESHLKVLLAPGARSIDPELDRLLNPLERARAILESPFDISPPTDERPYFFLQIRPMDVFQVWGKAAEWVTGITFKGIRALMALCIVSILLAAAVLLAAALTLPSAQPSPQGREVYRWMSLYFLAIGLGYILIQLGLHQRLIIILGHPTYALSVVLFAMLLGTGLGSAASGRLFPAGRMVHAWATIIVVLAALAASMPAAGLLERVGSPVGRAAIAGLVVGAVGFVLGFGFPIGVRIVGVAGEWAVQKMWAVNGAASIAGSALAALFGLMFGSRNVLLIGLACYLGVALCGMKALKASQED